MGLVASLQLLSGVLADEISDDVLALFAVVGRHDGLAGKVAERFAGLSDAIYASTAPDVVSDMPPGLIADIQRIPAGFREFGDGGEGGR